jgi:S1-C subfamily serine protease
MDFNTLDVVVVAGMLLAALGGYRAGLLARAGSWVGIGGGIAVAASLLPSVLQKIQGNSTLVMPVVSAMVLSIGASLGGMVGQLIGSRLRSLLPKTLQGADRAGGAAAGTLSILIGLWLLLPVLAEIPGGLASATRNSLIARAVEKAAPNRPQAIEQLRKFVGNARFPQVFEALRPAPDTGPVPTSTGVPPAVLERVRRSTVKVESTGCGAIHAGSGFAIAPDTIVTNAHVVAGGQTIRVLRPDGRRLTATVTNFNDDRDLAILRVPGLGEPSLAIGRSAAGQQGAVLGHPNGQDALRIAPAAVRQKGPALGRDIYGQDTTRRTVLFLASRLAQGDSGSAVVDTTGAVIGVAFAIAPDRPDTAYALADEELRGALTERPKPGSGACER